MSAGDSERSAASGRGVGILALQGDVREHAAVLEQLGARVREVRRPSDLDDVDALILPGGESTTLQLLLGSSGLLEPLRERLTLGMAALGTCAGMILLGAEVLDGRADQAGLGAIDVGVRRNAFGRQLHSFETDLAVEGIDGPIRACFIRAPVAERVGEKVEVLASVEIGPGERRAVVCRQGAVVVASFHPELDGDGRLHALALEPLARDDLGSTG